MISDILLYENGSGGEMLVKGNSLIGITGYENSTYLAMFGGSSEDPWWGGSYLCKTEDALRNNALNSAGRIKIEQAINEDLSFLNQIPNTKWSVSTTITGVNKLDINIIINGKQFNYSWNPNDLFLTYQV